MGKYLKLFENHTQYTVFTQTEEFVRPNVSHCIQENEVHYNPYINPCAPITNNIYDITYEAVDLGLPSGTLWANKNIGAQTETDYGLYFQWGDTEGFTQEQVTGDCKSKEFSWNDYKYGTESNLTKYNATDGLTTLELSDDAAHIHMGGGWRMPTKAEFLELTANTTNSWDSARSGYTFTANGNTLFLPACGMVYDGTFYSVSRFGDYWSSSLNTDGSDRGWTFGFDDTGNGEGYGARYYGYPIRAVLN